MFTEDLVICLHQFPQAGCRHVRNEFVPTQTLLKQRYRSLLRGVRLQKPIQPARLAHGTDIKRVFIVDDTGERDRLQEVLRAEAGAGIGAVTVLISEIKGDTLLRKMLDKLSTLDFGVGDNGSVWTLELDQDRKILGGKLIISPERAREFEEAFRDLYRRGEGPQPKGPSEQSGT